MNPIKVISKAVASLEEDLIVTAEERVQLILAMNEAFSSPLVKEVLEKIPERKKEGSFSKGISAEELDYLRREHLPIGVESVEDLHKLHYKSVEDLHKELTDLPPSKPKSKKKAPDFELKDDELIEAVHEELGLNDLWASFEEAARVITKHKQKIKPDARKIYSSDVRRVILKGGNQLQGWIIKVVSKHNY